MDKHFDSYFETLMKVEGGRSNDPHDSGGETSRGLTRGFLDSIGFNGWPDKEQTKQIYKEYFWDNLHCPDMSPICAVLYADACVNHGVRQGAKLLQRALGITADGIVGPGTLAAAKKPKANSFLTRYRKKRRSLYFAIAKARPKDNKFIPGWLNRIDILSDHCYTHGFLNTSRLPRIGKKTKVAGAGIGIAIGSFALQYMQSKGLDTTGFEELLKSGSLTISSAIGLATAWLTATTVKDA